MKRTLSGALLALLVLSGCGGGDEEPAPGETTAQEAPEADEAPAGGYGDYALVPESGGVLRIDLVEEPAPADDDLVTRAESMREAAGVGPVHWVPVVVDNTEGTETISIDYGVEVVTEAGDTIEVNDPIMAMDDWVATIGDADLTDDLYFTWSDQVQEQILPGAKYEGYLLADQPIDTPARVYLDGVEGFISD